MTKHEQEEKQGGISNKSNRSLWHLTVAIQCQLFTFPLVQLTFQISFTRICWSGSYFVDVPTSVIRYYLFCSLHCHFTFMSFYHRVFYLPVASLAEHNIENSWIDAIFDHSVKLFDIEVVTQWILSSKTSSIMCLKSINNLALQTNKQKKL